MRSINLYTFSREIQEDLLPLYEKSLSDREDEIKIRREEIDQIKVLVNNLLFYKIQKSGLANWFYSFKVPQIGKEFDLLKIGKNKITINIELKSQEISLDRIEKQLMQNRYYLEHISEAIYSFTCVKCDDKTIKTYKFEDGSLRNSSMKEIVQVVNLIQDAVEEDIKGLWDFLITEWKPLSNNLVPGFREKHWQTGVFLLPKSICFPFLTGCTKKC